MSDTVDIIKLEELITAAHAWQAIPDGAVIVPTNYELRSTEAFRTHRDRKRGTFSTTLVEDFANYFARNAKADKLTHAPIFIDPKEMRAVALFDWLVDDDLPGHVEHHGLCKLEALPEWASLLAQHTNTLSQSAMVDFLEDNATLITAFDDAGQGLSPSQLIGAFRSVKVTKKSEHAQQLEESKTTRSAFEEVEAGASIGTPGRLTFHLVPYTGFKSRAVLVRITTRAIDATPFFQIRIVGFEYLQHELAVEFVNLVQKSIGDFYVDAEDMPPHSDANTDGSPLIYVGKMAPLPTGFKNSNY
jgi:uncharacterized protein YfdQ (DUF2303 family)